MPIRVSEQQKATAFGAMMPLEGIDPGFVANWKAAWNESQDFQSSNANHANRFEVVQGFVDQFRQASGQPLPNWLLDEPVGGNDTVVAVWLLTLRVAVRAVLVLFVYVKSATATPVFAAFTPV